MSINKISDEWTSGTYVHFRNLGPTQGRKTNTYDVLSLMNEIIGQVKWFSRWRKYSFFTYDGMIFEETCLRDIADFCVQETKAHAAARTRTMPK